jgi:hypothetical protein
MQFLAVPGEVTLLRLIVPLPSLSVPSLPAAITKQKSLWSHTNWSNCRHWSS